MKNSQISEVMNIKLSNELPPSKSFAEKPRRAPNRGLNFGPKKIRLSPEKIRLALANALRYLPEELHALVAPEFLEELRTMGRIYAYRFRPEGKLFGKPIDEYEGIPAARALQVMIDNNLDFEVALYPYELVTYGETGQVFQNWLQYLLVKKYLSVMREDQTLVISSGHPVGLFPSSSRAPRVISTNGLLVGEWDNPTEFKRLAALGVSNYGQMTAGGWMYIGPQGIIHGTYITILNAARKYLGLSPNQNLKGVCFVSSGLGGMSCAQPKAVKIAGGVAVIAEVDLGWIKLRQERGWVDEYSDDLRVVADKMEQGRKSGQPLSIAYHGNIVDLLEYLDTMDIPVELISDQTSCHAVYEGGYTPVGVSFEKGRQLLRGNRDEFERLVNKSLLQHFQVIKRLTAKGARFWDYGNSFMAAIFKAGEKTIAKNQTNTDDGFIWPSYVEDIMGPICFDRGFGPFRWVCLSRREEDLDFTDQIALSLINPDASALHYDNYHWIEDAKKNDLVVGTKARILYADEEGRINIALAFNQAVREGKIGPIMLGRDHHDVSGTDSPYRETSDIYDGSRPTADMSVQCFAGNVARGMTMVVLSNGGGVGIGRASNGGNGMFLDGSKEMDEVLKSGLSWDVMGGVSRRSWARNQGAMETAAKWNIKHQEAGQITIPYLVNEELLNRLTNNSE
ncbi:MAG: urocanate hydratase [Candidatus Falkowbacteria bacterium]|nr:urocanate hydratase [Candidatus Falkowbacteria bacterium]